VVPWILCFVLLALLLAEKNKKQTQTPLEVLPDGVTAVQDQHPRSVRNRTFVPQEVPPPLNEAQIAARRNPQPLAGATEEQMADPIWRAAKIKELKIERYHKSPAKDTPACQAVVALLEKEGLGLEAVQGAYELAWENKMATRMMQGLRRVFITPVHADGCARDKSGSDCWRARRKRFVTWSARAPDDASLSQRNAVVFRAMSFSFA
jgi:hypothetical protein